MARIAVIGGGIAGRCVAEALGVDVDLYDRPGPRASDVPAAICHRFPGRTFDPPEFQSRAYERTAEWLERYPLGVEPIRILRKPNRRLTRSLTRIASGVAVSESEAGFEYGGAWVVDMPLWLTQLASNIETRRVDAVLELTDLTITTDLGAQEYDYVVLCPGASLKDWLPLPQVQVVHGEIAFFIGPIDKAHFGSSHVYPAGGRTAVGHTFLDEPRPDDAAVGELRERAKGDGHTLGESISVWRGARSVVHPDRLPILTEIHPNVFVLGALGAKGLLYAPYMAEALAAKILEGRNLPPEFRWPRLVATEPDLGARPENR